MVMLTFVMLNVKGQITFNNTAHFTAYTTITSYANGDFNNDGKMDVAMVNGSTDSIYLCFGDGSGDFISRIAIQTNSNPYAIVGADFNSDGNIDLITSNGASNVDSVSVLFGDGLGNFNITSKFAGLLQPLSLTVSDLNSDGKLDLCIGSNNGLSILFGDNLGNFATPILFNAGLYPSFVKCNDFNNDGNIDIIALNNTENKITILLNDGMGGFDSTITTYAQNPIFLNCADYNNDGKLDLAFVNYTLYNVTILLNDGMVGFLTPILTAQGNNPYAIVSTDFNGDNKIDIASANLISNNVSVILGDGNGNFGASTNFYVGNGPASICNIDFNNDGKQDLITCSNYTVSILINNMLMSAPEICMITINSEHTHNVMVWEKDNLNLAVIDSFVVYREIGTNVYKRIGSVSKDSISTFTDLEVNPNSTGYRYKLRSKSTNDSSYFSNYHNTIYLTNNGSDFAWTPYQVENTTTPVANYNLYRDDFSTGNFQMIGYTSGTQFGYTDVDFSSYPYASYYVEAVMTSGDCNPTRSAFNTSISNVKNFGSVGVENEKQSIINIYPNPASDIINITGITQKTKIFLYDIVGKLVFENEINNDLKLDVSNFKNGIYNLLIDNKSNKIVISH